MTIPEQAGKVASGAIEALKNQPSLLALILLQVAIFALLYFGVEHNNQRRQEREMLLLRTCVAGHYQSAEDRR